MPTDTERFWAKVDRTGACWLWVAGVDRRGYGRFWARGHQHGAHREAYRLTYGEIPDGLFVCHRCDTPLCVRPSHLFLGSHAENMQDMVQKGRGSKSAHGPTAMNATKTHCPSGHPYSEGNTYLYQNRRACRTCRAERSHARWLTKAGADRG